jgi:hypothetical protein
MKVLSLAERDKLLAKHAKLLDETLTVPRCGGVLVGSDQ